MDLGDDILDRIERYFGLRFAKTLVLIAAAAFAVTAGTAIYSLALKPVFIAVQPYLPADLTWESVRGSLLVILLLLFGVATGSMILDARQYRRIREQFEDVSASMHSVYDEAENHLREARELNAAGKAMIRDGNDAATAATLVLERIASSGIQRELFTQEEYEEVLALMDRGIYAAARVAGALQAVADSPSDGVVPDHRASPDAR